MTACSGSGWSATRSWAGPTPRPGGRSATSSTSRSRPGWPPSAAGTGTGSRPRPSRLGWAATETDWKRLIERDDVDLVDVCTPGSSHAEISIAALEAGKHVLCEKPLANTVDEARAMAAAAARAATGGVRAMIGFNFRRVPAVALARELIAAGRLGAIRHVRGAYLGSHPSTPSSRWPGGSRPSTPGRARSATSAPTSSTSPSTWPATGSPGSRR